MVEMIMIIPPTDTDCTNMIKDQAFIQEHLTCIGFLMLKETLTIAIVNTSLGPQDRNQLEYLRQVFEEGGMFQSGPTYEIDFFSSG